MEKILSLAEEEINKLTFKELMELIDTIKNYFISSELDIEKQIELYAKAILLLTKAREKLITIKKQKEEIDRKYEEFLKNVEE
ncbi:exodeoxyribonuclease VII [Fervidobacterium changbaicum]|uniref:Exodeoxyribonuclease VII n=1 Tax=Fervidobacterium changbaicum TaxID=310769 RepID=A0ABX5QVH1_9BACT|nr:exodeoxyribonuclease VII [Fervidobacterium changbaicum]